MSDLHHLKFRETLLHSFYTASLYYRTCKFPFSSSKRNWQLWDQKLCEMSIEFLISQNSRVIHSIADLKGQDITWNYKGQIRYENAEFRKVFAPMREINVFSIRSINCVSTFSFINNFACFFILLYWILVSLTIIISI